MKKLTLFALFLAVSPSTVWAHAGDHSVFTPGQMVAHLLTEPDHLAYMTSAILVMVLLRRLVSKRFH